MKYKLLVVSSLAAAIGGAVVLGGCQWRPFGRDYFVTEGDGKAGSSYGKPWINSVTYGTVGEDTPHTGENGDIYLAANFENIISAKIEEGQDSVGVQEEAIEAVSSSLRDIMKNNGTGTAAKQLNALYELYTDTAGREGVWEKTIVPLVKPLMDVEGLDELSGYLCSEDYLNNGENIVSFNYDLDYENPGVYSFVIIPSSLSLGDAAEYANKTEYGEKTEEIFKKQAALLLEKAGYTDKGAQTIIKDALDFEGKIAAYMKNQEFKYSSDYINSINNPVTVAEIEKNQKEFPLAGIIDAYGISECEHLYMIEPEWLNGMAQLYTEGNFNGIKSYLIVKTLQGYADAADEETYTGMRDIYNEVHGIKTAETLEDHAFSFVKNQLPGAAGRAFAETYVNEADKNTVLDLTEQIREKVKTVTESFSFLTAATKKRALEKLDTMKVNAAYSDTSPAVPDAHIRLKSEGGTLPEAVAAIREASRKEKLKKLNADVGAGDFDGDVTDVSVRYFGHGNSLMINAGAITGYIKDGVGREELLGGLGTLIAREMFNAVLGSGADYDADGKYSPYRTHEDSNGYNEEYKSLREELDAIKPFKNDTALTGIRVLDRVVQELNGFKAVLAIAQEEGISKEKLIEAMARSRFTVMREDVMENAGLNSSDALPYIVVNIVGKELS